MSKKAARKKKPTPKKAAKTKKARAAKSKRSPSKARKPAKRATPRTDIGIVSSIPFASGSNYRDAFENGLGSPVSATVVRQDLGYDYTALDYALGELNAAAGIHLIVTIGGVTPAKRAPGILTKPFISLVGSTLDPRLKHAVDLQNVIYGPRIDHLTNDLHFNAICLLRNGLSDMAGDEDNEWPGQATSIISADIDDDTDANGISKAFNDAFKTIGSNFEAVIVSGDPYFTSNADVLVPIANTWATAAGTKRRVVYPFVEYKAYGPANKHNYTIHGPDLKSAFKRLGDKVASERWGIESPPQTPPDDH